MLRELIMKNRSRRRFYEEVAVSSETLRELVELARFSASGGNLQPLKYILSASPEGNARIFPHLAWAGYLTDWPGPAAGERPTAYIIILGDNEIVKSVGCDHGIAAQSILLGAVEKGLGGCLIGSINRKALRAELNISDRYDIRLAVALGKPKETVVLEETSASGDIKYWRDETGRHHVPKRSSAEIIVEVL